MEKHNSNGCVGLSFVKFDTPSDHNAEPETDPENINVLVKEYDNGKRPDSAQENDKEKENDTRENNGQENKHSLWKENRVERKLDSHQ